MSHSVVYSTSDPTLVDMPEDEEIAELPEGDDDEAMIEEAAEDQGYGRSTLYIPLFPWRARHWWCRRS